MDTTGLILLLSAIPGIGDKTLASILHRNAVLRRPIESFLNLTAEQLSEEYGIRNDAAAALGRISHRELDAAAAAKREMDRAGIRLLTILDAAYPSRLAESMEGAPPVLYTFGKMGLLGGRLFAVANSNDASEQAMAACDRVAERAVANGWIPVTGHNRVPYQRTALVSRRQGGSVCYVLDRGLFEAFGGDMTRELFPAARIWSPSYDPDRDLSLSPFSLRAHGIAVHNQRRDSIIFGLAQAVIVGEVREGGQMERLCKSAISRNCPVYAAGASRESDMRLLSLGAVYADDSTFCSPPR